MAYYGNSRTFLPIMTFILINSWENGLFIPALICSATHVKVISHHISTGMRGCEHTCCTIDDKALWC